MGSSRWSRRRFTVVSSSHGQPVRSKSQPAAGLAADLPPAATYLSITCPAASGHGRIDLVCEGATFVLTASVPGLRRRPCEALAPAFPLLPELALRALRAVGERFRGILTTEVRAPALRCLHPRTPTFEAVEREGCDGSFAVLLLHRRGSAVETSRSIEPVTAHVQPLWNRWTLWKDPPASGGSRPVRWADPRVRPPEEPAHEVERRSPGRIGGPGRDAMRHPRGPHLAGSSRSRVLSETVCARPIPLRRDDRDRLLR